jgi:hypothetical protein
MKVAIRHIAGAFARLEKSRLVRELRASASAMRPENARAAGEPRRAVPGHCRADPRFAARGPVFSDRDGLGLLGDLFSIAS